mmetsp:Transcript_38512/g.108853  ORF Transcript_38512/g.108853 Transcript_38512/m.108853 type:complete len:108 (-) Transcript_38512:623-946(-)
MPRKPCSRFTVMGHGKSSMAVQSLGLGLVPVHEVPKEQDLSLPPKALGGHELGACRADVLKHDPDVLKVGVLGAAVDDEVAKEVVDEPLVRRVDTPVGGYWRCRRGG